MKFTEDILKKATIAGLADYLLFGEVPKTDSRDYMTRTNSAYENFEKIALKYNPDVSSDLLKAADDVISENTNIYMEIGIQAGILLMLDMLKNLKTENIK